MEELNFNQDEVNRLINSAWNGNEAEAEHTVLRTKFENRLTELNITPSQAVENLQIEFRTVYGILDGSLKRLDILSVLKLAQFLEIPYNEIIELYTKTVADKNKDELIRSKKRAFILSHFDLQVLKNIGVIDSIRDFDHIEERLTSIFGIDSILDYDTEETGAAHSETKIKPKNGKSRNYFKNKCRLIFRLIDNPHRYDKQALVDYFPKIRWHSTDVDGGLINVIRSLFDLGVTVIFHPKMPLLQLRGATFAVNEKPCIVLTDYMNSYPTLWFALLHELFHVLFDWDEILRKRYHLSDEENDLFVVKQKEDEANDFAREYLFPKKKLEVITPRIKQKLIVREYAVDNHVHPSIVYENYANANSGDEQAFWSGFDKLVKPPMNNLLITLADNLTHKSTASDFASYYKINIFNIK